MEWILIGYIAQTLVSVSNMDTDIEVGFFITLFLVVRDMVPRGAGIQPINVYYGIYSKYFDILKLLN